MLMIVALPSIIHPSAQTKIEVHGPIDISDPQFFDDSKEGFSNVHIELKNNENITRTFVELLQFQDSRGYTTQIVQSKPWTFGPDEELLTIIDFENEVDARLVAVFV